MCVCVRARVRAQQQMTTREEGKRRREEGEKRREEGKKSFKKKVFTTYQISRN
jgi:hypothetical protein